LLIAFHSNICFGAVHEEMSRTASYMLAPLHTVLTWDEPIQKFLLIAIAASLI